MLSVKENFLETLKRDGKPDRLVNQWEPFAFLPIDPICAYTMSGRERGKSARDRWGTMIIWPEEQMSGMPHVTDDDKVVPDITRWREYAHAPDLAANCAEGWDAARAGVNAAREAGKLAMGFMPVGLFEQLHFLMGFEDMLMNFLLEPEAMRELCEYIGDWRLAYAKMLVEQMRPDIILSHDDWGSKTKLFVSPAVWREFIRPQYERLYGYIKSQGILVMHHSDSFAEPIVGDMVELGIDIWQGALPENDIARLQTETRGALTFMGGIAAS
ncbi:MAG: uroporphyrinogen decarboxylase (URO-D), partial [Oscillospiraceae bacterium]|nr:uroporphyrinogen decarboxylase (URO-D) [Oscillospiraceae bacterium]